MKKIISIFCLSFFYLSGFFAQTGVSMQVDGMSCGYCVNSVSKALKSSKELENINVDLQGGKVSFQVKKGKKPDVEAYKQLITKAGYKPGEVTLISAITTQEKKKTKTDTFLVHGNCGMCESKIEKAALSVKGVKKADWDRDTHLIIVTYNPAKTELIGIHKAIAAVGYDTDLVRADDKTYNSLHDCCKYDRSKE